MSVYLQRRSKIRQWFKRNRRFFILGAIFIGASALIYYFHFQTFRNPYHIFIYMIGDLAFLPLEVFIVVIVIERILAYRERQSKLQKLNMVVGAFFSEVGNRLISDLLVCCTNREEIFHYLGVTQEWTAKDFKNAEECAKEIKLGLDYRNMELAVLKSFLIEKRAFLLRLLENPNLLEHERFTDILWAVFHLAEELEARTSVKDLPDSDLEHIAGDIQRVYGPLVTEWLRYLEHLKSAYPFLFSLIARTHPFQTQPSPIVT
jgi:hypothetical protein